MKKIIIVLLAISATNITPMLFKTKLFPKQIPTNSRIIKKTNRKKKLSYVLSATSASTAAIQNTKTNIPNPIELLNTGNLDLQNIQYAIENGTKFSDTILQYEPTPGFFGTIGALFFGINAYLKTRKIKKLEKEVTNIYERQSLNNAIEYTKKSYLSLNKNYSNALKEAHNQGYKKNDILTIKNIKSSIDNELKKLKKETESSGLNTFEPKNHTDLNRLTFRYSEVAGQINNTNFKIEPEKTIYISSKLD